mmetsp:Transcript_22333/g.26508  ORF Transcript_22333/g.26508 Transcript_22333/m.26508 type:complete len:144 (+) Transcript_22333:106-537(+)
MVAKREDTIAKEMFFVGLLGLPWLWIVNIMYFWDTVYGRLPCFGDSPSDTVHAEEAAGFLGMMENNEEEEEEQENQLGNRTSDEPTPEEIKAEVTKWVKRSSIGSAIAVIVFVSWTISFQLNQDNFGPKWFVMSQDDEDRTGW